jgi:uncharacterized protein (DUF1919 family)
LLNLLSIVAIRLINQATTIIRNECMLHAAYEIMHNNFNLPDLLK